jgi:hypothetical protein
LKKLICLFILFIALPCSAADKVNIYDTITAAWRMLDYGPTEIDAHTAQVLTADQLLSTKMTTIHNASQAADNVDNTLPATVANLGFLANVATAQAANYWRFTAATAGTIYLNGSATGKDYVQYDAPEVGNYFSAMTQRQEASYVWIITDGIGALTTN